MRILLDVHPLVRCGPEPVVGEHLLRFRRRMDELTNQGNAHLARVLDDATAHFLAEVIERMGKPAAVLCHKDPRTFVYLAMLGRLFPQAKFIHMLRDGRAAIFSSRR
ncbi:protein-tyrosine sulfotransferase [Paragonimus westermani]|uniref:Protein-tyrosine sulfotransferase n=1 Tax=Paragonimus westermani TaxID=34504 RepID=A0A5J4NC30_9TREM|nr:protein-tyrosine sulfotransferase [Paragonimus westermani]